MNEIVITQTSGTINANFEEVKAYLSAQLEEYRGLVFSEDTKKSAKDTVAELRKEKKALGDRVKEVKKEYMKPFDDFYAKATELADMFDEPIAFINGQVEDFEKKRIEEKKELIKAIYEELNGDMAGMLPLSRIYNPKWENATTNQKSIRADIMEARQNFKSGLETIKAMRSDMEDRAIEMFKDTLDISEVVRFLSQYEAQKREIMERETARLREEEAERIRAEERAKIEAEQKAERERLEYEQRLQAEREEAQRQIEEAVEVGRAEVIEELTPVVEGDVSNYVYTLSLTKDAKEKLEMYLDSVGIEYSVMEV